jgi:hypothetical protein
VQRYQGLRDGVWRGISLSAPPTGVPFDSIFWNPNIMYVTVYGTFVIPPPFAEISDIYPPLCRIYLQDTERVYAYENPAP